MPYSGGRGGVPIPAAPVPSSPNERGERGERRRSKVLQSSLDLVFSYSRSQQLRYGPRGTVSSGSAPSFVDGYTSSASRSHSNSHSSPEGLIDETEEAEADLRDSNRRWDDLEAAGNSNSDPRSRERTTFEDRVWSRDEDATFFPSDPVSPSAIAGPASPITSSGNDPPSSHQQISTEGANRPFSANYFTPLSSLNGSSVSAVASDRSVKHRRRSDTPRPPTKPVERKASVAEAGEDAPLLSQDQGAGYAATSVEVDSSENQRGRRASQITRRRSTAANGELGQSTDGQTLFNATAVLIGIGLLSLPLAFAYSGWIAGSAMLMSFGWLTCHTAKLLARLIRSDRKMLGYTDIGLRAFGGKAAGVINVLFCLELFALGVALVVLFGDSLNVLYPSISSNTWKTIGFAIILPTALLPLRLLSLPSLLSSISSVLLVVVLIVDGFIKPSAPGSLREPMPASWTPEMINHNWLGGIGLVLAGFGGHAVMPSLARDMKRPENFDKVVNKAFAIATVISFIAGAAGYLMIGQGVSDEITRDLMVTKYHYPRILNLIALWMIVVNPLTKFGLSSRPLNVTIEGLLRISPKAAIASASDEPVPAIAVADADADALDSGKTSSSPPSPPPRDRRQSSSVQRESGGGAAAAQTSSHEEGERRNAFLRVLSRTIVTALCTVTAIALPGFGKVMAFLGSFSAFLICIILPLLFYLRLEPTLLRTDQENKRSVRVKTERAFHWTLVAISTVLMIGGTVWTFLPGSGHGGLEE